MKRKFKMNKARSYRLLIYPLFWMVIYISVTSCGQEGSVNRITTDEAFRIFFYSDSGGITGADGLFSLLLPDGSSLFMLGDCFLGKVVNGTRDPNTTMLRNAFVVIDKNRTSAEPVYRGSWENPLTLMEPVNEPGDSTYRWYWPGHGFVRKDTLYLFALGLVNIPDTAGTTDPAGQNGSTSPDSEPENIFTFAVTHVDLLSFSLPGFRHLETRRADIDYAANLIDFGNCVLEDGDYIYIYGTKNLPFHAQIHVARVPAGGSRFYRGWEYYTGEGWDKDIGKSEPMDIDISVSEQFSIFRYRDKYILLTQERSGNDIYTYISDLPYTGFHNKKFIYHTPEPDKDPNEHIITYNALAHSQYIENGRLLVSYCVNSLNIRDIFDDVEAYRARFLRVPLKYILKE